jgi:hypothetical protein
MMMIKLGPWANRAEDTDTPDSVPLSSFQRKRDWTDIAIACIITLAVLVIIIGFLVLVSSLSFR